MNRLLLASTSPRRVQLLKEFRFDPQVASPEVDELACDFFTPVELTLFNANRKAVAVAARHPLQVVLAADTVVAIDADVFGKPRDFDDARRMLNRLVGRTHLVITGVAIVQPHKRSAILQAEETAVSFRPLTGVQIDEYLKSIRPFDKAGAYAAQDSPEMIIKRIKGSFTNVIGLPMELVVPLLGAAGIRPAGNDLQKSSH